MYRAIIWILLYINIVSPAPQENTNATNPNIEPTGKEIENATTEKVLLSESNIEKVQIPILNNATLENEFTRHIENVDFTTEHEPETTIYTTHEPTTNKPEKTTRRPKRKPFKPNPRFVSNLSYYKDNTLNAIDNPVTATVDKEKYEKRRFRSRCRCEKIWNCPKLQITVPRCPDEYFLCCF